MGFFTPRKKGITPSELKNHTFSSGVPGKVLSALKKSGNSTTSAKTKSGAVLGVIEGAMASGYGNHKVAEKGEVLAGLETLEKHHVISEKERANISAAMQKELEN